MSHKISVDIIDEQQYEIDKNIAKMKPTDRINNGIIRLIRNNTTTQIFG